jgi:RimJ/RimL family protein N-acetyltransferase/GNAT superfamily N-acetyltransferase
VIDLDQGWRTERLELEPLSVEHAAELAPVLDDAALHEFTGGAPLSPAALTARYARLAKRRSPDGHQLWGNWVMRVRGTGMAVGTMQMTLPADGPAAGPAEVAWVVGRQAQGRGYAKEAASGLVALLREAGWTVIAHIHPAHLASQRVARAAGLSPTGEVRDGEVRWIIRPAAEAEQATFVIRAAGLGDMSALRDVFRRSSLSNDGDRANLLTHPEVLEFSDLAVREGRTRAAVADDRLVGFATWLGTGNILEIEDLFVDPERMRQGIGRALVLDLIAIARDHGVRRVEVTANQHALAFYETTGFVVDHAVTTMFGPAPRMHMEIASMGGGAGPVRLR